MRTFSLAGDARDARQTANTVLAKSAEVSRAARARGGCRSGNGLKTQPAFAHVVLDKHAGVLPFRISFWQSDTVAPSPFLPPKLRDENLHRAT